jgi:hypothetical protein
MTFTSFCGNRRREDVRAALSEWNGTPVFGVSCAWFTADDGTMQTYVIIVRT